MFFEFYSFANHEVKTFSICHSTHYDLRYRTFFAFFHDYRSNNLKQSAAPITVANNGSGLSKNSLTWTTTTSTKSDMKQNEIYSNAGGNSISSDSTNTDRSSSSNDTTASSAAMTTKRTLLKKLPSMGRKIAEVFRNAKLKPNDEPPEPPPPDYRNETFDVDDQPERVYDCIDERKLNDIVYAK